MLNTIKSKAYCWNSLTAILWKPGILLRALLKPSLTVFAKRSKSGEPVAGALKFCPSCTNLTATLYPILGGSAVVGLSSPSNTLWLQWILPVNLCTVYFLQNLVNQANKKTREFIYWLSALNIIIMKLNTSVKPFISIFLLFWLELFKVW